MHPTAFHFGFVETILFKEWHISNWSGMLGSAIAIALLAALYEFIKYYRERLRTKSANKDLQTDGKKSNLRQMFSSSHSLQTVLVAVQVVVSNLLMLIFMTYNVYLCIALIFGATLAYFLLMWKPQTKPVIVKIEPEAGPSTPAIITEIATSM